MIKKDLSIIDFLKFIASIIVVAIHTTNLNFSQNIIINNIWNSISILAVPFFFISTGYLSFYRHEEIEINQVKKILYKFLKIYIICMIVYLPITIIYYIKSDYSLLKSIIYFIRSFLFIGENYNSWPLWYLLSSIYCFIILYFFCKFKFSPKKMLVSSLFLLFLGFGITILSGENFENVAILSTFNKGTSLIFGGTGRLLYGIGYVTIGMYIGINKKEISHSRVMAIIFLLLLIITPQKFKIIIALGFISFGFINIIKINYKPKHIDSKLLRTISTVTYFTHMIFYTLLEIIVNNFNYRGLFPFVITLLLTWVIGISYYYFHKKC